MQCGCPFCGTLTVQVQQGLDSHCVCPDCGWRCSDCMGGEKEHFSLRYDEEAQRMKQIKQQLDQTPQDGGESHD